MEEVFKDHVKGKWIAEECLFSDLKDGNQTFYMVDPFEHPNCPPSYPVPNKQEPDTHVWVVCEVWLLERLGYNPCLKKPEREKSDRIGPALSGLINSKGSDWF